MLLKSCCIVGFSLLSILQTPKPANENVRWHRAPDPEAIAQYTPYFANMIGVSARIRITCVAIFEGTPQNCQIVSASPEGLGYERAGMLVAATGVIQPTIVNGTTVPSLFNFAVSFRVSEIPAKPDPEYDGPEPSANALKLARTIVDYSAGDTSDWSWTSVTDDLSDDRREIVLSWLNELFPVNIEEVLRVSALGLARSVPEAELASYVETGIVPFPLKEVATAYEGTTQEDIKAMQTLRVRYCARWSCEIDKD